jgi:hypothetical protein
MSAAAFVPATCKRVTGTVIDVMCMSTKTTGSCFSISTVRRVKAWARFRCADLLYLFIPVNQGNAKCLA